MLCVEWQYSKSEGPPPPQDWDAMVSLLLDEKCGIVFTDDEEGVLIEIMACAVRRATGAKPPAGRGRGRVRANCSI